MPAPPKINTSLSPAYFAGIVLAAAALGVCAVVFCFNPARNGFYPVCLFHRVTGWNCPGCGATRALYELLHGDVGVALRDNAFFVLGSLLAALRGGWMATRHMLGRPPGAFMPAKGLWILLVLLVLFGVIRNLPGFEWLSPA